MLTLRQDLELLEGEKSIDGSRRWILRDPINNKFFKMDSDEIKILAYIKRLRLDNQKIEDISAGLSSHTGRDFSKERVGGFLAFLKQNNLLTAYGPEARAYLMQQYKGLSPGLFQKLLKNYLFIKIDVIRPNEYLEKILPWARWFFTKRFWVFILLNTLLGFYLTSRQLDFFLSTFVGYLNFSSVIYVGIALAFVKIIHELGHALTTKYYGCSVHSMGIAFLIFWPVLFTDTTDAWRLSDRKQRMNIGLAGIMIELAIASLCLTLWYFVPPGMLKSILFILATTTWILTLAINLNPLMRFDGYFVLSDWLGMDNLQDRSFELGRWKLREWMFGYGFPPPETPRLGIIFFAYAVWIYRFLLYFGIAVIIYAYFFKLLGVVLMTVQFYKSLVKPLSKELRFWWDHRKQSRIFPNITITFSILAIILLWLLLPTQGELKLPAYIRAADTLVIYAPESGQIVNMMEQDNVPVEEGELLMELAMPDLAFELQQVERDISLLEAQLATLGVTTVSQTPRGAILAQLRSARQQQTELSSKLSERQVLAPFTGIVRDINSELSNGQWVSIGTQIMTLLRPSTSEAVAYVSEQDISRVNTEQDGIFYFDGGTRNPLDVRVTSVETFPVGNLDELYAASAFGGGLPVRDAPEGNYTPQQSSYRVYFSMADRAGDKVSERILRGSIVLPTTPISPINRYWRNLVSLWRREAGF